MKAKIRVHLVTYKRPHLLKRAIDSVVNQTFKNWIVEVINDDIEDKEILDLIHSYNDDRIILHLPYIKRGGTGNFNYAFSTLDEEFACILEDDNWYEKDFLQTVIYEMERNPKLEISITNEKLWNELENNIWEDTGKNIWKEIKGTSLFNFDWIDKCGKAKVCNSSMVWRTKNAQNWKTPSSIPIDITEHYRERVLPHPILLIHSPLVNYAQTIQTFRSGNEDKWIIHQSLLIASVFAQTSKEIQRDLAIKLWQNVKNGQPLLATSLLNASLVCSESRLLFKTAPYKYILRYFFTFIKRFHIIKNLFNALNRYEQEWNFLIKPNNKSNLTT